ncbi:MAG: ATP-binding cassette domain-containing protein, partial [Nitriliruptorales bacterium]
MTREQEHEHEMPHRISAEVHGTPGIAAHGTARLPSLELHLDLDARAGEVLGLVGPNGAGKSATLAVLLGLVPLVRGTVAAGGRIVDDGERRSPPERRGIGWCPQT